MATTQSAVSGQNGGGFSQGADRGPGEFTQVARYEKRTKFVDKYVTLAAVASAVESVSPKSFLIKLQKANNVAKSEWELKRFLNSGSLRDKLWSLKKFFEKKWY